MKTYILPFIILAALFSACREDDPQPVNDPFVGSWELVNTAADLRVSFNITSEGGELVFDDIQVMYHAAEASGCRAETYYRYPVNAGYREITIACNTLTIAMEHSRIHLKTPDQLEVYVMEIAADGQEPVILADQVFIRL